MARVLTVRHATRYSYRYPVRFGPHRMAFRPRDSHTMRLLRTGLSINPLPARISWHYDVFGNSIAVAHFAATPSRELTFLSEITIEAYASVSAHDLAQPAYPPLYDTLELPDLAPFRLLQHPQDADRLAAWSSGFVRAHGNSIGVLEALMRAIRDGFVYRRRFTEGTQSAAQTLDCGSGTCRDFALLMMEGARTLGFAARFVTGYVYAPASGAARLGGGSTHAWAQIYLAEVGWVDFDPTNAIIGNRDLIKVAVARDPGQALPLSGSWIGMPGDYLGMTVSVDVAEAGVRGDATAWPGATS